MPPAPPTLPKTPVICGPTAGGKSALAVELALALRDRHGRDAQIVTADAFQVYAGLDIGTAKPTVDERRGVEHHLIDVVPHDRNRDRQGAGGLPTPALDSSSTQSNPTPDPDPQSGATVPTHPLPDGRGSDVSPFTLDHWLTLARSTIADLRSRHILPIVVGGTHLYIKALLEGLFDGPKADPALRDELTAMDPAARRAELERVDPAAAARIHPNDIRRTVRALEVFRLTGIPISQHQQQWDQPPAPSEPRASAREASVDAAREQTRAEARGSESEFQLVILDWDAEVLNRRINARVKDMMSRGLLDEVRRLMEANAFTPQSAEALGYKQLIPVVQKALESGRWPPPERAIEEAAEQIKIETRRFGKNQRTWLRRLGNTPGALRLDATNTPQERWMPLVLDRLWATAPAPESPRAQGDQPSPP